MSNPFRIAVRQDEDVATLFCSGVLGAEGAGELLDAVDAALEGDPSVLTFDGKGVTALGDEGLTALLAGLRRCGDAGVTLELWTSTAIRRACADVPALAPDAGAISRRPVVLSARRLRRIADAPAASLEVAAGASESGD